MNEYRIQFKQSRLPLLLGISLLVLPGQSLLAEDTGEGDSIEATPQLSTYADIDRALDSTEILPSGGEWRYVPGTEEPSEKFEWAKAGFDDSTWMTGAAPFYYGIESTGTEVPEFGEGVTTVYMRSTLQLPELKRFDRIVMEIPTNDGFVFYFNGSATKRRNSGEPTETPTFDFNATSARTLATEPVPVADLTRTIRAGANQLAIHGLIHADEENTFGVAPTLRGTYRRSAAFDKERHEYLASLLQPADDAPPSALLAYLDGRYAQRSGDAATAAAHFVDTLTLDPSSAPAWDRLVECRRNLGTLAALDTECRAALNSDSTPEMLDAWVRLCLEDLGQSPAEVAAALPDDVTLPPRSLVSDTNWLAAQLAADLPIRIDCGRERDLDNTRDGWSRDRFYSGASIPRSSQGDGTSPRSWDASRSIRLNARAHGDLTPTYRIPLAYGAYELRLTFVGNDGDDTAPGDAVFDVVVEGARLMRDYDPVVEAGKRGTAVHSFPIWIADGFLDLDLLPQTDLVPWIAGVEIRPLDIESYHEHAAAWVAALEAPEAFPLVQLGEALWRSGDTHGALSAFEQAEARPDFLPHHAERLGMLRLDLLPELLSFASADDLVERYPQESESRLGAIRSAAGGDSDLATYLSGRIHQQAGRIDESLGEFEQLLGAETGSMMPLLRMAQCLVSAGLPEHAADLTQDAVFENRDLPDELLSLWISLNLTVLGRDTWDVIRDLEQIDTPDQLVVVPTSEEVPRSWRISVAEPPSTSWSRTTFDASIWPEVQGAIGTGHGVAASIRSPWSTDGIYARRTFTLPSVAMLYPHVRLCVKDAANIYINGTSAAFSGITTEAYITMPARENSWNEGENVIGIHAFNSLDSGNADAGIVQPLGDLMWVARELDTTGALRINCGGPDHTTADGKVWHRDRFFGWAKTIMVSDEEPQPEIEGTGDDILYTTMRFFYDDVTTTWYQIPVPNGRYRVTMHFAELETDKVEGERTFHVALEKYVVLPDYDIAASVGLATADSHSFDIEVSDDWLDLRLFDADDYAVISAFEIEPILE